jgi:hypothetical protein
MARTTPKGSVDGIGGAGGSMATAQAAPRRDGSQGCSVDGCEGRHAARGFCRRHYETFLRGLAELASLRSETP